MNVKKLELRFKFYIIITTILITIVSFIISNIVWLIVLYGISILVFFMYIQHYREQYIKTLSSYLQEIYQGSTNYDIREYCEGELSVLKSDLYKLTHTLKQQTELLRKDKCYLANSLSDISHQIKTPLTSMLVVSDLLNEDLPVQKRYEFIQLFQSQLKRVEWLVSSLLKMSKIDADTVVFHKKPHQVVSILEKSIEPFGIMMELKQQNIHLQIDEHLMIQVDEHWIIEAFSNIIKNCLEHSEDNTSIDICAIDSPLYTRILIKDQGCGIEKEDIPHIFERFYKGKNASNDSVGIGLALSKSILIQHQASIQVESELRKGSTFTITFHK